MEKTFSKIEISVIKSTAKNVAPFVAKKAKVDEQIASVKEKVQKMLEERLQKLELEKKAYQDIIDSMNGTVKQITGGYTTEDLIEVKKEATGQMDKSTGKEIMKTVYALKYPETVVPPTEDTIVPPTTEDVAGSDYDKDAEAECPTHEEASEEMPEELIKEQAEADPFANGDGDPFNQ
jgi:hypothetical protein